MRSKVYYVNIRERYTYKNLINRFKILLEIANLSMLFKAGDRIAIKIEIGEYGYINYLRPSFIYILVEHIRKLGGEPILFDTTHLNYMFSLNMLEIVARHGFVASVIGKDVLLGDGYTGNEHELLPVDGEELGGIEIARLIAEANALIIVAHVTAHPFAGLSGALVNMGIGGSAQRGKRRIHAPLQPILLKDRCNRCGLCIEACLKKVFYYKDDLIEIDYELCAGCAYYCTAACPRGALVVDGVAAQRFQKRIVEAATAVYTAALGKVHFFNFLIDITPYPDYYPFSDSAIVPDIGILSSRDPVAIDQVTLDLIDRVPALPHSIAEESDALAPGCNKLKRITGVDPELMLKYAEQFGLGSRSYELIEII